MSLILDALKKAKELGGRKPAPAPAALASFRFGRPSRSQKIKQITLFALLGLIVVVSVGYTANVWMKRLRKPRAVLIQAPPPTLPANAVDQAPAAQEVAQPAPAETPKEQAKEEAPARDTPPAAKLAVSVPPAVSVGKNPDPVTPVRPSHSTVPVASTPAPRPTPPVQTSPAPVPPAPIAAAAPPAATNVATQPSPAPSAPPSPSGRGEIARDPFDLAVFYQKSGDYLKALEQYNKVLEKDPLNASVYNNLGLIHYATNNTLEAIKAFRQATFIDPKYDKAHNNLGLALRQAGQEAEAQREFERALQLNPKNAEALTNLAALARKSGNIERAKMQYLQAIQANPANAEAHYNLAVLYEEQGETGSAIDHFKKFLMLGSSSHPEVVSEVEKKIEELSKKKE